MSEHSPSAISTASKQPQEVCLPDPNWHQSLPLDTTYDSIPSDQSLRALDFLMDELNNALRQKTKVDFLETCTEKECTRGMTTFLLRMIFLCFAEERGLFQTQPYKNQEAPLQMLFSQPTAKNSHRMFAEINSLIDFLFSENTSATCSGSDRGFSLFHTASIPFLQAIHDQKLLSDAVLHTTWDIIHTDKSSGQRISFGTLPIEQLGTIFERLLEIKMKVSNQQISLVGGLGRKNSGAHYTPRILCDFLVAQTISSVLSEQATSTEILSLRICDPAMGSGAFLLSTCRYLSQRLMDCWAKEAHPQYGSNPSVAIFAARAQIAEHCLFGVDINPLAAQLAQLSLWLEARAFHKPFSFLQQSLKTGNSVVGLHPDQLASFSLTASEPVFHLSGVPQYKQKQIADLFIRYLEYITINKCPKRTQKSMREALIESVQRFLTAENSTEIDAHVPDDISLPQKCVVTPIHWTLAFPSIFGANRGGKQGFDVLVGNPPFINCIRGNLPAFVKGFLKRRYEVIKGSADLSYYFLALASEIGTANGAIGLILPRVSMGASALQGYRSAPDMPKPSIIYSANHHRFFAQAAIKVVAYVFSRSSSLLVSNADEPTSEEWKRTNLSFSSWWPSFRHNWWAKFWTATHEQPIPEINHHKRLIDMDFEVHAGLTTSDFYNIQVEDNKVGDDLKLMTSGGIDPQESLWGSPTQTQKFNKANYRYPRICQRDYEPALLRKLERSRRPKIIIANLTKEVEAFFDEHGECQGATATQTIFHKSDNIEQLRKLCALLHSDYGNHLFHAMLEYNAMHSNISMEKSFLQHFPIPVPFKLTFLQK